MDMEIFRPGYGVAQEWRVYGRTHDVPDGIAIAGLIDQLNHNTSGQWTGFLLFESGRGVSMPSDPALGKLDPTLWNHLRDWCEGLNRMLHSDGHWVVAWDHVRAEARLLFRDADGDLQVVVEIDEGVPKIFNWAVMDALNQAAIALEIQRNKVRDLGADRPTIRLAQGQRPH